MILDIISPDSRPGARNRGATQFEIQAALIPQQNRFQYQSPAALVRTIKSIIDSKAAEEYFIYFEGIGGDEFDKIKTLLRRAYLVPSVRLTFENALDAAIIRITPAPNHRMGADFRTDIMAKIPPQTASPVRWSEIPRGQIPGARRKEGDAAIVPVTRGMAFDWPAVVIEFGSSQGLDFYRSDAKWWLINSAGLTRFVIIVQVFRNPDAFHFECWKMIPSGRRQTRQTRAWIPGRVQDCDIDAKGVVVSASSELRIPFDCIFDVPPNNASDLVYTNAELSNLALWLFPSL